jgi:hypothetical protein
VICAKAYFISAKLKTVLFAEIINCFFFSPSRISADDRTSQCWAMAGNVTLWQFLLELLRSQHHEDIIAWTTNEENGEFKLIDAEKVAQLWGMKKNKTNMNYDKLSRALRYYYDKGIIRKVMGQKFVYRCVFETVFRSISHLVALLVS